MYGIVRFLGLSESHVNLSNFDITKKCSRFKWSVTINIVFWVINDVRTHWDRPSLCLGPFMRICRDLAILLKPLHYEWDTVVVEIVISAAAEIGVARGRDKRTNPFWENLWKWPWKSGMGQSRRRHWRCFRPTAGHIPMVRPLPRKQSKMSITFWVS
jgi:hypothetical protein